ncbi:MAG: HAMP domain-containing sensor histidine kinase [Bacteroidota bacterium]|mgnify:CR=1 FL=1
MKEQKLKIIIALMTVSVIGLIAVQFYWMANIIKVEEDRFRRTVFRSLRKVSEEIEKKEAATTVVKKVSGGKGNVLFFVQDESKNKPIYLDSLRKMSYLKIDTNHHGFSYEVKYFADNDTMVDRLKAFSGNNRRARYFIPPSSISNSVKDTSIQKRHLLVQNVITELMAINAHKKIEERISADQLDKNLSFEFSSNGISSEFYFGVNRANKDSLTLLKKGIDTTELKKSIFKVNLFPDEIFFNPNQLIVYFPHQKRYILASVGGMLVLSVGLILVIVGVFYKTVEMFLSQKKITAVKNDLINNITHEFKTPISTISIACEALNEPGLLIEKNSVTRYSKIIKEENDRLKMMVDALLNTAALEKSELNLSKEKIDLHELILSAASKFENIINNKSGRIIFELNASRAVITGDKFHLTNIMTNLIDNAVKYNESPPEIKVSTRDENKAIIITVKDNGIGISKEHLSKIFETFYRVSSGNIQNVRGNGIGLSYAKKIVETLGGDISVTSEAGVGSEFKIILPNNGVE